MAETESIRRVEEGGREAAKTIDSIWGANSDCLLAHTEGSGGFDY